MHDLSDTETIEHISGEKNRFPEQIGETTPSRPEPYRPPDSRQSVAMSMLSK